MGDRSYLRYSTSQPDQLHQPREHAKTKPAKRVARVPTPRLTMLRSFWPSLALQAFKTTPRQKARLAAWQKRPYRSKAAGRAEEASEGFRLIAWGSTGLVDAMGCSGSTGLHWTDGLPLGLVFGHRFQDITLVKTFLVIQGERTPLSQKKSLCILSLNWHESAVVNQSIFAIYAIAIQYLRRMRGYRHHFRTSRAPCTSGFSCWIQLAPHFGPGTNMRVASGI